MSLQMFCRKNVVKIFPEATIADACELMEKHQVGSIVAEIDGKLCGILTDRDIALKVTGQQKDPRMTKVAEIMTADPIRITVNKDLQQLTHLIHAYHVRRIPIVDGFDRTLGIVTLDDVIALIASEMSEVGKAIAEEFLENP
jgi:CBS domain-containing protein